MIIQDTFNTTVQGVLDNHGQIKKKSVRVNDGPFIAKTLRRAVMNRTRLRITYGKDRTTDNLKAYKKQRNKSVNILRQAKEDYYKDLDIKDLTDNRNLWRSVKPLFDDKVKTSSTTGLGPFYTAPVQLLHRNRKCYGSAAFTLLRCRSCTR